MRQRATAWRLSLPQRFESLAAWKECGDCAFIPVCAGGCTATPALAAVQEAARSSVPSIGYGVAYAVGNVFLAIWGTVIVLLMA